MCLARLFADQTPSIWSTGPGSSVWKLRTALHLFDAGLSIVRLAGSASNKSVFVRLVRQVVGLGVNAYLQMLLEDSYVHTGQPPPQHLHEVVSIHEGHNSQMLARNLLLNIGRQNVSSRLWLYRCDVRAADLHPGNIFVDQQVNFWFNFCHSLRNSFVLVAVLAANLQF